MDQVAVLTAILLLSILGQGAVNSGTVNSDQPKMVAEIPFNEGETQILHSDQISKLYEARNAVVEAQKHKAVRVIIEGHFSGPANTDNTRRAVARALATKRWLQTVGGLYGIAMDDRLGASGENKRVAKILIEEKAENEAGRRVLTDIVFSQNSAELRDYNPLWEVREEIRNDVQQKGPARLVIEGHAAQSESNAAARAENRAVAVKRWFEGRQPIPNLQLLERAVGSQENKSVVRLIIERERRQASH
jgi:hypothetical protein